MNDLDLILKALDNVARTAEYNTTGPDMFYKLLREIERLREKQKFAIEQVANFLADH